MYAPHDLRAERAQSLASYTSPDAGPTNVALPHDGFIIKHGCAANIVDRHCLQVGTDSRLFEVTYLPTGNGSVSELTVTTYDVSDHDSVWGEPIDQFVDRGCDGTNDELQYGLESEQQARYEATVRSVLAILKDPAIN